MSVRHELLHWKLEAAPHAAQLQRHALRLSKENYLEGVFHSVRALGRLVNSLSDVRSQVNVELLEFGELALRWKLGHSASGALLQQLVGVLTLLEREVVGLLAD